ncbi:MAG: TrbI/VirB10 family protein [Verrucomicrobiales bacterium]|nr:TrbI/VirB10 family protein [Verrucomicrobiales bacterium]
MNISGLLDFLRTRLGLVAALVLILIIVVALAFALRPVAGNPVEPLYQPPPAGSATSVERPVVPEVSVPLRQPSTNAPLAPLSITVPLPAEPPPPGVYAPYGRLIRCQVVNTVDSANIDTPIIALVTDDLWHDGASVVPTGTEVHGRANADRMRERIVAEGEWTLVWQNGSELHLTGIALDREEHPSLLTWGITDGSAGLRGQVLHSDVLAEVKLFLATFMSGMASGMQETQTTRFGLAFPDSARNAALSGTSEVLNRYAEELAEIVRRDGIYIRVPGGKQMYLYVTQRIDLSDLRQGNAPLKSPTPVATATPQIPDKKS